MTLDQAGAGVVALHYLIGGVSWAFDNAIGVAVKTISDELVDNRLADTRRKMAAVLRGQAASRGWFADRPQATSTNHDLLRALRAAWVRVAQQKLDAIRQLQQYLVNMEGVQGLPDLPIAQILGTELQRLEANAADRTTVFRIASPVENALIQIVEAAPEQVQGDVSRAFVDDLTEAFVSGVMGLWTGWELLSPQAATMFESLLREPIVISDGVQPLEPGEAILNRFVENLKSGVYREASTAYQILIGGLIRDDIGKVRTEFAELAALFDIQRQEAKDALLALHGRFENVLDETGELRQEILSVIRSSSQDIKDSINLVQAELARIEQIVRAPDHSLKGTVDSSNLRQKEVGREFYGRNHEVEMLLSRCERSSKSLSLVTAPAGIGKSAFMAEVARRASARGYSVVSHFITRKRQDTLEVTQVLGHLALQLRAVYRTAETLPPIAANKHDIRNEIDSYLSHDRPDNRPLLVLVDGLDTVPEKLPVFTPARKVGRNIHVVLSCRVGQPDELPTALNAWGDANTAQSFEIESVEDARLSLQPLESSAILVWLSNRLNELPSLESTARSERIHALTTRVEEISEGLALFVSYLINDITKRIAAGENIDVLLRRLKDMPPSFAEYVKAELTENTGDERPPYGPAERKFLGLAAVAMGPLWDDEIGLLIDQIDPQNPPLSVVRWLSRVRRQGDDVAGWIIQHPRLAQPLKAALTVEAVNAQESLLAHCKKTFEERSTSCARYAAVWGPKHLMQADDYLTATSWMSNSEILRWRLEVAPERETIRAMSGDFVELERQSLSHTGQLAAMASVFVTIAPTLYREVER